MQHYGRWQCWACAPDLSVSWNTNLCDLLSVGHAGYSTWHCCFWQKIRRRLYFGFGRLCRILRTLRTFSSAAAWSFPSTDCSGYSGRLLRWPWWGAPAESRSRIRLRRIHRPDHAGEISHKDLSMVYCDRCIDPFAFSGLFTGGKPDLFTHYSTCIKQRDCSDAAWNS